MFIRTRHVLLDPNTQLAPSQGAGPADGTAPVTPPSGIHQLLPHTIGAPEPEQTPEPVQLTPEQQRLAALEQQNAAILQQNQQMLAMLMTQQRPQGPAQPQGPQPLPAFTLDGIPDPVQAPKDFTTQLTQRIQQREQQLGQFITHNVTQQIARGAAMDGVFNMFRGQHAELAKKGALLQGAAFTEFQALQQQGIDPVTVAQQNPDTLVARIAARMQQELGVTPQGGQPGPAQNFGAQPNAARAAGIGGGSGTPVQQRAAPAPLGFVEQLNKARRESGLI